MLDNAYKLNNNLLRVILLLMPREIQLSIFEQPVLTAADRVCLALTCKTFARALTSNPKLVTYSEKIQHGEEEFVREVFLDNDFPDDEASENEIDEWAAKRKKIDHDYRKCVDQNDIDGLLMRLDRGWNRSTLRMCIGCGKFVSVEQSYWDRRDQIYSYRSNSIVAVAWRRGTCHCGSYFENGGKAREYAKQWVNKDGSATVCPPCKVLSWRHCDNCHYDRCSCCCGY